MKFNPDCGQVVFISLSTIPKKDGSGNFNIVKIADPVSYENLEFFPSEAKDFKDLQKGELINCCINIDGRFTSIERIK